MLGVPISCDPAKLGDHGFVETFPLSDRHLQTGFRSSPNADRRSVVGIVAGNFAAQDFRLEGLS
jgi:hypothetical protein